MGLSWGWQLCCMIWDARPVVLRALIQHALRSLLRICWQRVIFRLRRGMRFSTRSWLMAARRIAFLRLYLQELQHELAEGGSGYDMFEEVTYHLLWGKRGEEQEKEHPGEDLQRGRVVDISRLSEEQHSAWSGERCTGA